MRPKHWLYTIPLRLRSLFRWAQADQELDDELRDHLERATEEYVTKGMTPEEAQRRARLDLGGIEQTKEKCREERRVNWIQDSVQDFEFGLRILCKSPGFTVVAVLTLALGIGANTAIFSLVDAVLIRMLPVQRPEQLFRLIDVSKEGKTIDAFSYPTFELIQENNQTLSGVIAFHPLGIVDFVMNGKGELAHGQAVSGSYFTTLGVKPILGRTITTADEARGASHVAVISYGYWTTRFNRSPSAVGAEVVLNGSPFTIIGVTPPEFFGLEPGQSVDVSIALTSTATVQPQFAAAGSPYDVLTAPFRHWLHLMVRLRDGQTEVQALANLGPIYEQAMRQAAEGMRGLPFDSPSASSDLPQSRLKLESGSRGLAALREQFSKPLAFLMAVVGMLLLIACTNVANLLLSRSNSRQSEIALRLALGAGRARVLRQLLTESVLLAAGGGGFATVVAFGGSHALANIMSHSTSAVHLDVQPDMRILAFTALVSLVAVVVFGLFPAWRASRLDLSEAVKEGNRGASVASGRSRIGEGLVIPQIALSLVLTVGAGLLVRTLENLKNSYPGFREQNVLLFSIRPGMIGYTDTQVAELYERLSEQIKGTPTVSAVTFSAFSPLAGWSGFTDARVEGYTPRQGEYPAVSVNFVGPRYFRTLGTAVLLGRDIAEEDRAGTPKVAVINEAMAQHFFGDSNPIGRRFSVPGWKADNSPLEIVGVVENAKFINLRDQVPPAAYIPFFQSPDSFLAATFEARSSTDPTALAASIREMIQQADSRLPLFGVKTLNQQIDETLVQERMVALLSSLFGLLALFLACVGLYGVMSSLVVQRTHEIGIRMALGAERLRVLRLILGRGMAIAVIGVVGGVVGAVGVTRFMATLLFGVKPTDIQTMLFASLALIGVATFACYIPARRAMCVDPMVVLRYE
ncbi:MAG TPA: ABC transporter permease [Candidatus Sulfotelmatobacter sp.]|nr:ABC transporter permease [Candidatus Sulfotelmatobacter sp.]